MSLLYPVVVGAGCAALIGLHLGAGARERRRDRPATPTRIPLDAAWVDVGAVGEIPENRAKVVCLPGRERIAVFRYGNRISAVTNVCAHQRGPLGEGKIVDGCITCPWHGWEYRPENGCSPPPFQEKIATFRVVVANARVLIDPNPLPPGTPVEPALIPEADCAAS